VRTPKVPRLRDETESGLVWISHEVLWSAMRLRIAFNVHSHFRRSSAVSERPH